MRIAARTVSALGKVITGDSLDQTGKPIAPYQSGPKLVAFFNQFGTDDGKIAVKVINHYGECGSQGVSDQFEKVTCALSRGETGGIGGLGI